jgi:diacylglycerol kinase (ATP)
MKNQPFHHRLRFSLDGLSAAWKREASFRTQALAALAVVLVLALLRPAALWWALLLMHCFLVLGAELFNTGLEHALDRLHAEVHPSIKIAKDCAAAGVLMATASSVVTFGIFLVSEFRR